MTKDSNAIIGGGLVGLVFIGIAILIGGHFYEQCFDSIYHLGEYKCLSDESVLKDTGKGEPECCTTKYSWQAWCCGLPFAIIGIAIIGASLSGGAEEKRVNHVNSFNREKKTMPNKTISNKKRMVSLNTKPITKKEVSSKDGKSLADGIKELNKLKEQGILDDDEFKSAKKKLIEKH